ncbi:DUF2986 domain-containing protein [Shewanella sp. UCD-KL21]|uniref:DUF2986 domain-containing protein n=1 Tax=Shewanella sp. UCD-KL21 TaxID=1917164 RepID=UPI0009710435|nr:DUF2986 domain-containing protein [Shewanella sp. UCD-KL21]
MNRRKKINSTLKAKAKKANAKNVGSNKPAYVAKADRIKLDEVAVTEVEAVKPDSDVLVSELTTG